MDGWREDRWMGAWVDGGREGGVDGWIEGGTDGQMDGWVGSWMDGRKEGQTAGWVGGGTDRWADVRRSAHPACCPVPVSPHCPWGTAPPSPLAGLGQIQASVPSLQTQPPPCHAVGMGQRGVGGVGGGGEWAVPGHPLALSQAQASWTPVAMAGAGGTPSCAQGVSGYCEDPSINGVIGETLAG